MTDSGTVDRGVRSPRLLGGRYEVGEVIGHGGMADVYLGFDVRLSRTVAIKVLRADLVRDSNFRARFRREAQSAAGLNHPSIVAVYDSGEDTGVDLTGAPTTVAFIVMELVEGQTLRDRLDDGPLPPREAARITESVLSALAFSHRMGIVHRDIKPANVMVSESGEVKVMDFGIARAVADTAATVTQTQAVLGTAQYLSPEQAQGIPVDARCDLYSTGCLLFELLTGRPPFVGDTPIAVAYQHVGQPPPPPSSLAPGVPRAYDAVVLHALAKDREARYQTAAQFRADLAAARDGRPVSAAAAAAVAGSGAVAATQALARPASSGTTALRPVNRRGPGERARRRRRVLALGALVLVLFTIAGKLAWDTWVHVPRVAVPAVVGKTEEQARTLLQAAGLVPDVRSVRDLNLVAGTVTAQEPPSDTLLDRGAGVRLAVSSGPGEGTVPALVGQPQDAAVAALTAAGFPNATVALVDDPSQAKGHVVGTEPGGGDVALLNTAVTVRVASGNVKVPNLVGQDTSSARTSVSDLRLRYDDTQRVESVTVLEGRIVAQDVPPDSVVEVGTLVKVRLAVRPRVTVTTTQTITALPQPPPPVVTRPPAASRAGTPPAATTAPSTSSPTASPATSG